MKLSVKKKAITTTALISMTDVVFLLLLFVLITSNFVSYTGVKIDIPRTSNAYTEMQKNIVLSIDDKETLFLNGQRVSRNDLPGLLRNEITKNPDVVVMIQADQNIALKKVMDLIDISKSAGSNRFFIAAQLVRG
jgi:biopolymer transport protein ExbD